MIHGVDRSLTEQEKKEKDRSYCLRMALSHGTTGLAAVKAARIYQKYITEG
jgi:hypothetical protein